jgi:heme-degrading monooxygenase HmoA
MQHTGPEDRTQEALASAAHPKKGSVVVTIFRSRLNSEHAPAYNEVAARMKALAEGMPGFVSFKTFWADDQERVSIVEFESEEALHAWRNHPDHRKAQQLGRERFYSEFQIQVCSILRQYDFRSPRSQGRD